MNRRAFLKLALFGIVIAWRLGAPDRVALAGASATPPGEAYGAGAYGAATYPGYAVYAPAAARGGN